MANPQHSTTRRNLLASGAAVMVAGSVPALSGEHPDAELLELERRLEALLPPMARAIDAHWEAHERAMEMLPPESTELKYCGNDARLGLEPPPFGVWNKHHVKDLRDKFRHRPDVQARFDHILALVRQREQVWRDVADASGWTKAGDDEAVFWDETDDILARAREIEPQTIEGAAIKARFVAFETSHLLFDDPEPEMDWEPKVAREFVASMMRLGGRDFLMRPWEVQS